MFVRSALLAVSLIALVPTTASAVDPTLAGLRSHRAVYDLKLARRTEKSDIGAVTGRLVYEFVGSPCDGYSSQFRLVTRLENTDGKSRVSDMRTSSFEDSAGNLFEFLSQNFVEQVMTDESKGSARRSEGGLVSSVTRPVARKVTLPDDARFPTQHMVGLIQAAKTGQSVAQIKLYDGSDGGERVYDTTAVIGKPQEGADDVGEEAAAGRPEMASSRRWPMTISYFDPSKRQKSGEETPDYQLGFLLYENGISRRLKLDYGDFALDGRMTELTFVDVKKCE